MLDFPGRAIKSSVKNAQLVAWDHNHDAVGSELLLQFAKVKRNTYCLDCRYPMSLFQAFAVGESPLALAAHPLCLLTADMGARHEGKEWSMQAPHARRHHMHAGTTCMQAPHACRHHTCMQAQDGDAMLQPAGAVCHAAADARRYWRAVCSTGMQQVLAPC